MKVAIYIFFKEDDLGASIAVSKLQNMHFKDRCHLGLKVIRDCPSVDHVSFYKNCHSIYITAFHDLKPFFCII